MRWMFPALLLLLSGRAYAEDPGFGEPIVAITAATGRGGGDVGEIEWALYADGHVLMYENYGTRVLLGQFTNDEMKMLLAGLPLERIGSLNPQWPPGFDGGTECIIVQKNGERRRDCYWPMISDPPTTKPPPPREMLAIWRRLRHSKCEQHARVEGDGACPVPSSTKLSL